MEEGLRKGTSEKELSHERSEGKRGGRKRVEEGGSNGAKCEGEEQGRRVGGREIGMEANIKGGTLRRTLASIQYYYYYLVKPPLPKNIIQYNAHT